MSKKYWQSFGELNNTKAYNADAENEFKEDLPFEMDDSEAVTLFAGCSVISVSVLLRQHWLPVVKFR